MIVGIGTDLCEVARMALALERQGPRLRERLFTPEEQAAADASPEAAEVFARCFALQEACFKALGRGWPDDIGFDEIRLAQPTTTHGALMLTGRAAAWSEQAGIARWHAAVTSDASIAAAVVVAEGP